MKYGGNPALKNGSNPYAERNTLLRLQPRNRLRSTRMSETKTNYHKPA